MLTLAFDTATNVATSALVWDDELLAELDVAPGERAGGRRRALPAGRRPARPARGARRGHRAEGASRACGWGSRPPARCRSRSRFPSQASRRCAPSRRARRGRCRSSTRGAVRCSCSTGSPRSRPRTSTSTDACASATAQSATGRSSGRRGADPARRRRAAPAARAVSRPAGRRLWARRARRADLSSSPRRGAESRMKMKQEPRIRTLQLRDLPSIERIERDLRDAVVAVDVRGRAVEAVVGLPGRVRREDAQADRLPDRVALRRRMARDEHRGCARTTAQRRGDDDARAPVRGHRRRRSPRLHARGPRVERGRSSSTSGSASNRAGSGAATTRTTARTR